MTDLLTDEERQDLKTVARRLVDAAGGLLAAAAASRVEKSQLAEYYNVHKPGRFMPVDVAAALQRAARAPHMAAELARLAGHQLTPIDSLADPAGFPAASARAAIESAEALAAALAGAPAAEVEREAREAQAAFAGMADRAAARRPRLPAAPAVEGKAAPAASRPIHGGGGGRKPRAAR